MSCAAASPLVGARFLPLADLPQHAAQVALWHAWMTTPALRPHYTVHPFAPYSLLYLIWSLPVFAGLRFLDATRLAVLLCLISIPLSLALLLRSRGRPVVWSFLAFPALYNHTLGSGFLPFYFSISVLLAQLAAFSLWMERRSRLSGFLATLGGLAVIWAHALTAAICCLVCTLMAFMDSPLARRVRQSLQIIARAGHVLLPIGPIAMLMAAWTCLRQSPASEAVLAERLSRFASYMATGFTPSVRGPAMWPIYVVAGALLLSVVDSVRTARRPFEGFDFPILTSALSFWILYLALPADAFGASNLTGRLVPIGYFLFVASLPGWDGVRRGALVGSTILAALAVFVRVSAAFCEFDSRVGPADAIFASLPAGASVIRPNGATIWMTPYYRPVLDHFATWAQVWTLGPAIGFCNDKHMLVQNAATDPVAEPIATLVQGKDGAKLRIVGQVAPDFLLVQRGEAPEVVNVAGSEEVYERWKTSGDLALFSRGPSVHSP